MQESNADGLNTLTVGFSLLLTSKKEKKDDRENEKEKNRKSNEKEIVMFNLMKASHAVLVTDINDKKKC